MDNSPDQKIRRQMFWLVLAIAAGIIASGFIIEKVGSYSLVKRPGIKFGYTGFQLAQIPSKEELRGKKRIIMLGNSVYQYEHIPEYVQEIADKRNSRLVFINMAQISSTIYDYLAHTAKVVGTRPDLIVFCMNEGTFSLNPRFKTDSDQFVFDRDVLKVMPAAFYFQYFTYQTAIDSALSSLIPLKRIDSVVRWEFKLRYRLPDWFFKWVSYPSLISVLGGNVKTIQMTELAKTGDEKFIVLQEVLDILQKQRIPALFIWQEAKAPREPTLEYKMIRESIECRDNTVFVDLTSYWSPDTFRDTIHPKFEYTADYARRHYDAVTQALVFFKAKGKEIEP